MLVELKNNSYINGLLKFQNKNDTIGIMMIFAKCMLEKFFPYLKNACRNIGIYL